MAVLFLVRHGQTPFNNANNPLWPGEQLRASSEIDLDDTGKLDALTAARVLLNRGITSIVSSKLTRTIQTAQIIQTVLNLPLSFDSRLDTWDLGYLSGQSQGESPPGPDTEGPPIDPIIAWYERHPDDRVAGGETYNDFLRRATAALKEYEAMPGPPLCLVTHGRILDLVEYARGETDDPPIDVEDRPATGAVLRITPGQRGAVVVKMAAVETIIDENRFPPLPIGGSTGMHPGKVARDIYNKDWRHRG